MRQRRLVRELQTLTEAPLADVHVCTEKDEVDKWNVHLKGPRGCVYEDQTFTLKVTFPADYPLRAPEIGFVSPIFHPNVDDKGDLCMLVLYDDWSPAVTMGFLLNRLKELLAAPNVAHPMNTDAAVLFQSDFLMFEKRVKDAAVKSIGIENVLDGGSGSGSGVKSDSDSDTE